MATETCIGCGTQIRTNIDDPLMLKYCWECGYTAHLKKVHTNQIEQLSEEFNKITGLDK